MDSGDNSLTAKIMDLLLDTVFVVDGDGRFVYVSASSETLLGYRPEELIGVPMIDLVLPEDRDRTLAAAGRVMAGMSHIHFQNRYLHKNGQVVDIMWSARWSEEHQLRLAVARDVTALKFAARKQEALYRISESAFVAEDLPALYGHIHRIVTELLPADLFLVAACDESGDRLDFPFFSGQGPRPPERQHLEDNPRLADVIRSGKGRIFPSPESPASGGVELAGVGTFSQCLMTPLSAGKHVIGALVMARARENPRFSEADNDLLQFVCTQIAMAIERKRTEARLQFLATHDQLTGLPNRALFNDRLSVAIERARRDDETLAVFYLDLNQFKELNDGLGHHAGDRILREFSARLARLLRKSDTVARVGGDEFTVLAVNIDGPGCVRALTERIRQTVDEPFTVDGHELRVSVSIGVAIYPDHGTDPQTLSRYADGEMYKSKTSQRRSVRPRVGKA